MRDAPAFIVGSLLLFSLAGVIIEKTFSGASPQGQDTVIITRNGNVLSGVMRLNGTDIPLTDVRESNGFLSFTTTFPVTLASVSHTPATRTRPDTEGDRVAKKPTDQPETAVARALGPYAEPPFAPFEEQRASGLYSQLDERRGSGQFFQQAGPGDPHRLDDDGDGLACEFDLLGLFGR